VTTPSPSLQPLPDNLCRVLMRNLNLTHQRGSDRDDECARAGSATLHHFRGDNKAFFPVGRDPWPGVLYLLSNSALSRIVPMTRRPGCRPSTSALRAPRKAIRLESAAVP
jgi:hypothetical protein